ncbi:MAG: Fe-S cluster assembly protein SufD [Bacteroidetes bacterium]|nr:Fe-S cluster assembly protein SufD [Bacteroidota bacterium]
MVTHSNETNILQWYKEQFQKFASRKNGESEKLRFQERLTALDAFLERGFPHRKDENWRFTNIQPITRQCFKIADRIGSVPENVLQQHFVEGAYHIVVIDGIVSDTLSDTIPSITVGSVLRVINDYKEHSHLQNFKPLDKTNSPFVLLNTAFFVDGVWIEVPDNVELMQPIQILFITTDVDTPTAFFPRNRYSVGKQASVTIIEKHTSISLGEYFVDSYTEINLGEQASLHYTRLFEEGNRGYHVNTTRIEQHRLSSLTSNVVVLGGALHRNDFVVSLAGEQCSSELRGLSFASGTQLIDHHTLIEHNYPHCKSTQLYKAILDGKARGVFNGRIYVHPQAQKTDAQQSNKTLLLCDDAMMHVKPQLEIFADDVRCTHGAAVGQLDATQLFYLRSRGVDEVSARTLLTIGFANEALEGIEHLPVRTQIENVVTRKLEH